VPPVFVGRGNEINLPGAWRGRPKPCLARRGPLSGLSYTRRPRSTITGQPPGRGTANAARPGPLFFSKSFNKPRCFRCFFPSTGHGPDKGLTSTTTVPRAPTAPCLHCAWAGKKQSARSPSARFPPLATGPPLSEPIGQNRGVKNPQNVTAAPKARSPSCNRPSQIWVPLTP